MKVRILDLAIQDLKTGEEFYERQQSGLGDYFLDTLFSDIDALLLHAGVHAQFFGYYRALSKRFPFAIYYRIGNGMIEVWRVLDSRQNPPKIARAMGFA